MRKGLGALSTKREKAGAEMGASETRRRLDLLSTKGEKAGGQRGTPTSYPDYISRISRMPGPRSRALGFCFESKTGEGWIPGFVSNEKAGFW